MIHQLTTRNTEQVVVRCDVCGKDCEASRQHDATEFDLGLARASAKFAGWQERFKPYVRGKVLRQDVCPNCTHE